MNSQVALITGASRGIGRAIAMRLASEGYTVIGTATTEAGAEAITTALTKAGVGGQGIVLDVTDVESIESQLKEVSHEFQAPSILV
ncbi:MAG: SDR family NAD(P)-dependent oxidoreductase, partial [Methylococcales bacterium]|nr:SDR family NAD(P)-dependent oxidoreductase [Methylococcales bacterium]